LRQHQDELQRLGVRVVAVTFEERQYAKAFVENERPIGPLLLDETRALYHAYGMHRGRFWQIWSPANWWAYIVLIFRGRRVKMPTDDVYQLGGDVLVDPGGIVRLNYVSRAPVDRPSVEEILAMVRK
jgi:alkyl hydroperoxide reductase subunit AhpC